MAKKSKPLTQTSVRFYESDIKVIKRIADDEDRDVADILRKIVNDYVKANA